MTRPALHATCVAVRRPEGWRGLLIAGPSGSGKSDLALRLMASGWRLVGDDYVHVWADEGALYAAPPARIAGRIEARGLGLLTVSPLPVARLALRIECAREGIDRLPEPTAWRHEDVALPSLRLDPRTPSAPVLAARALVTLSPSNGLA